MSIAKTIRHTALCIKDLIDRRPPLRHTALRPQPHVCAYVVAGVCGLYERTSVFFAYWARGAAKYLPLSRSGMHAARAAVRLLQPKAVMVKDSPQGSICHQAATANPFMMDVYPPSAVKGLYPDTMSLYCAKSAVSYFTE